MVSQRIPSTESVVEGLLGRPPPVMPAVLSGDTRITSLWQSPPFEGQLPGFKQHALVAHVGGYSDSWLKSDGKVLHEVVAPETVTVCPGGRDAWRRSSSPIEVVNVFLGPERLQSFADEIAGGSEPVLLDRLGFEDPKLFALLKLLGEEVGATGTTSLLFVEHLLDLICLQLLRAHSSRSMLTVAGPRRGLAPWQVKRVTAYMRDHLGHDIGLQELADLLRLSRFHFCRSFRLATGSTPHEWLTRLRISTARKLLADPALRITDVALAVGYETPSAFAAIFRRHVGVSPSEYRRDPRRRSRSLGPN